jgi:hypothetical protein
MEGTFILGLSYGTGLFQQVGLDVCSRNVTRSIKVDTDKFTLKKEIIISIT